MSEWGIASTASEIEKIKAESANYLRGLVSYEAIDWNTYNWAFDFYMSLLDKAYEQGKKDAEDALMEQYMCGQDIGNPEDGSL